MRRVVLVLLGSALTAACQGQILGAAPPLEDPAADATAAADARPGDPDAGAVDASDDPAPPSGAVGCDAPGLTFCDDFDAYPVGEARSPRWTPETASGRLAIDDTRARAGQSLHVHTDGNGRAVIRVSGLAPPGNQLFGRVRLFVDAFPSAPSFAHFTLVEASGTGAGLVRPVGGQFVPPPTAGRSLWGVGSDGGPTGDWTSWQTTAPAEAGRWVCVEWEMRGADNGIDVWIDGVAKPEMSVSTRSHGGNPVDFVLPRIDQMSFGWQLYQGGSTPAQFDVWLDDIALGPSRLGC